MVWLTRSERAALVGIGIVALAALGVLCWQRQRPALTIEGEPTPVESAGWDTALQEARRVDVNTADVAALERLPGIGPTLARRLVEYRAAHGRFRSAAELTQVRGIGPQTTNALVDYVTVE